VAGLPLVEAHLAPEVEALVGAEPSRMGGEFPGGKTGSGYRGAMRPVRNQAPTGVPSLFSFGIKISGVRMGSRAF